IRDGVGVDALQAANIEAVLLRVGPALMVRVDATMTAEVMLGRTGIELVELEMLRAFQDAKPGKRHRSDNGAFAATDGAVTTPGVDDSVRQIDLKFHGTAVTRSSMLGFDSNA